MSIISFNKDLFNQRFSNSFFNNFRFFLLQVSGSSGSDFFILDFLLDFCLYLSVFLSVPLSLQVCVSLLIVSRSILPTICRSIFDFGFFLFNRSWNFRRFLLQLQVFFFSGFLSFNRSSSRFLHRFFFWR